MGRLGSTHGAFQFFVVVFKTEARDTVSTLSRRVTSLCTDAVPGGCCVCVLCPCPFLPLRGPQNLSVPVRERESLFTMCSFEICYLTPVNVSVSICMSVYVPASSKQTRTLICFWLSYVVFLCSACKNITQVKSR